MKRQGSQIRQLTKFQDDAYVGDVVAVEVKNRQVLEAQQFGVKVANPIVGEIQPAQIARTLEERFGQLLKSLGSEERIVAQPQGTCEVEMI